MNVQFPSSSVKWCLANKRNEMRKKWRMAHTTPHCHFVWFGLVDAAAACRYIVITARSLRFSLFPHFFSPLSGCVSGIVDARETYASYKCSTSWNTIKRINFCLHFSLLFSLLLLCSIPSGRRSSSLFLHESWRLLSCAAWRMHGTHICLFTLWIQRHIQR